MTSLEWMRQRTRFSAGTNYLTFREALVGNYDPLWTPGVAWLRSRKEGLARCPINPLVCNFHLTCAEQGLFNGTLKECEPVRLYRGRSRRLDKPCPHNGGKGFVGTRRWKTRVRWHCDLLQ